MNQRQKQLLTDLLRAAWNLEVKSGIVQKDPEVLLREWGLIELKEAIDTFKYDDPSNWQQIPDEVLNSDLGFNAKQIVKWKSGLREYIEVKSAVLVLLHGKSTFWSLKFAWQRRNLEQQTSIDPP